MSNMNIDIGTTDLDSILNSTFDDLADLKEFKPMPVGRYKMTFDWEPSDDPVGIRFKFKVMEIYELNNPEAAEDVEVGQNWHQLHFWLTKEGEPSSMGQGRVKEFMNLVQPVFGGEDLKSILDAAVGCELVLTTTQRRDRKDPNIIYDGYRSIELYDPEIHG